jgi:hypothetical protein
VVVDGVAHETFDEWTWDLRFQLDGPEIVYSPGAERLAYKGCRDGGAHVVADGVAGPAFDDISPEVAPTFSPDGGHLVYGGMTDRKLCLVYDQEAQHDETVAPIPPAFSGDSQHLAYAVELGTEHGGKSRVAVVCDGRAGPEVDALALDPLCTLGLHPDNRGWLDRPPLVFSARGGRLAYLARRDGVWHMCIDGVLDPPMKAGTPATFSNDGMRVAYVAIDDKGGWSAVVDGVPGPRYDCVTPPVFSPDGARTAYFRFIQERHGLRKHQRARLVMDGEETGPEWYDAGLNHCFSPDGGHFAYVAAVAAGGPLRLVVDDIPSADDFRSSDGVWFSRDGRLFAALQSGKQSVLLVGGTVALMNDAVGQPVFSPDGTRWACASMAKHTSQLVIDGVPGPTCKAINIDEPPRFSPDGRHVGCIVVALDGGAAPVVDNEVGPVSMQWGPVAFEDERVWCYGVRGSGHGGVLGEGPIRDPVILRADWAPAVWTGL